MTRTKNNNKELKMVEATFMMVVNSAIGTTRECNDGSGEDSFTISKNEVDGIAKNLAQWWGEKYGDEGVEITHEYAEDFFNEIYPEI